MGEEEWGTGSKLCLGVILFLVVLVGSLTVVKQADFGAVVEIGDTVAWDDALVSASAVSRAVEVWGTGSKRSYPNPCFPIVKLNATALDVEAPSDAPLLCVPRVVILGVMKGATTFLYSSLLRHPMLWSSHIKETNFFTSGYSGGLANYASYFIQKDVYGSPDSRILFEASPAYLSAATARDRMFSLLPDAQLIVSLRDPVTRAYSHWNYFLFQRENLMQKTLERNPHAILAKTANATLEQIIYEDWHYLNTCFDGLVPLAFKDRPPPLLGADLPKKSDSAYQEKSCDDVYAHRHIGYPGATHFGGILSKSMYAIHLRWWLQLYRRDQLMVLRYEDLEERGSDTVLNEVCWWLGISELNRVEWAVPLDKANIVPYRKAMAKETEQWLTEFFRSYNEDLYELLGEDFGWKR